MHRKNSPGERRTAALLCCTGMRIEEVLGLRWEDIDTERGCIHIRRAVVHPGRNMPEIKSRANHPASASPSRRTQSKRRNRIPPEQLHGPVKRNPASYTEAAKSFKRIQKQCGVEGYTAHDFRDACAIEWRESGISIDLIVRLLGHKKTMLRNKDMSSTDPNYSIKSRIKWMSTE